MAYEKTFSPITAVMSSDASANAHVSAGSQGFLSAEECQVLFNQCVALARGGGEVKLRVASEWTAGVRWARSRAHTAYDRHRTSIWVVRTLRGTSGQASTTRIDDTGLRDVVRAAESSMADDIDPDDVSYDTRPNNQAEVKRRAPMLQPTLWSDTTFGFDGEKRGLAVREMLAPAESAGMLAAGELRVQAKSYAYFDSAGGPTRYYPVTRVAFSTTIRDRKGTGSGWAGVDDYDVSRVDIQALGERALDKCRRSINPVAVEPGRYTTILEPQAVADLFAMISGAGEDYLSRLIAEQFHAGPFATENSIRIGERVMDPKIVWSADPMDSLGGFLPFDQSDGTPYVPIKWVDHGVLKELAYFREYGLLMLGRENAIPSPGSWRVHGGSASVDEMIASTKRGLLVTRFHNIRERDKRSLTCTGYTRDGVWLIENGKITKPVKNFRFTESPIFALNRVEQIGAPQRVFSEFGNLQGQDRAWIAPPIKVRDFNFTQLADAV